MFSCRFDRLEMQFVEQLIEFQAIAQSDPFYCIATHQADGFSVQTKIFSNLFVIPTTLDEFQHPDFAGGEFF